jgi:hypothetical protein
MMSRAPFLAGLVLVGLAAPIVLALTAMGGSSAGDLEICQSGQVSEVAGLDAEQARNAGIIVAVGQAAEVPAFGLHVALATAMQESSLRNLDHGDQDSLGLFQQRPSAGWGTPAQLQDPVYAAQAFFGGENGPNGGEPPGLLDQDGWQHMSLADAAQAVQRSAHPDAYARWEKAAAGWLAAIAGTPGHACDPGGGLVCPPTGLAAEDGLTPDALRVLRCIASHFPQVTTFHGVGDRPNDSDHPSGRAVDAVIPDWGLPAGNELGWQVAEWVRANHVCLGVTYVIWDGLIWSADRSVEVWRPYEHPNGWTDANSQHLNHVHVSVHGNAGACVDGAWVVPIAGDYVITARFGQADPRWSNRHTGVDLAAPVGRPVLAAAGGQVTYTGWDGVYGQRIEITHLDGTKTWSAHLSAITVGDGAFVAAGEQIGLVGSTGNSTGPHLHYEIRISGVPTDPVPWMAAKGAPL